MRRSLPVCNTGYVLQTVQIRDFGDEPPTEEQTKGYLQLALNILQGLKQMDDRCEE